MEALTKSLLDGVNVRRDPTGTIESFAKELLEQTLEGAAQEIGSLTSSESVSLAVEATVESARNNCVRVCFKVRGVKVCVNVC